MSDISIPGVSNKYNTSQMIEDIMELERIPVQRLEEGLEDYEFKRQTWRDLNVSLSKLRDSSKNLYGFQNPFNSRIAESSDEFYLTGTANREAIEGTSEIDIKKIATPDRFLSSSLNEDFEVPSGTYGFQIGDDEISIRFRGGKLSNFADTINRRSRGLLRASVIRDTAETMILSLETNKTGAENRLFFEESSTELALDLGILQEKSNTAYSFLPEVSDLGVWSSPLNRELFTPNGDGLTLSPGAEAKIPFALSSRKIKDMVLEFSITVRPLDGDEIETPTPPSGPSIPASESITFEDLTIESAPSLVEVPEWTPPPEPVRVDDDKVFFLQQDDRTIALEPIPSGNSEKVYRITLDDYVNSLDSFNFRNRNTHKEIDISNIRVYDPNSRGDYEPANPISVAADAELTIDGIPVSRAENSIDDLIPGVTLNLKRPTEEPVELDVGPDREAVKDEMITFVGYYNHLIAEMNVLTSTNGSVIDELDYISSDEEDILRQKLGLYQGDSTLRQLKNRVQRIMMDPYESETNPEISLLAQAGISTNSASGNGLNTSRLRGYLEIDEDTLDQALESDFEAVKELFGSDSDGDLIIDQGAAFALDSYIKSYVETGGILSYKISTLDTTIERTEDDIDDYNLKLEDRETQLRIQYGTMEGALETMQRNSQALQNLNNNNN